MCRDSLGFKRTLFNYLLGGTVKNFICVFALVAMVGLAGCAGIGKGKKASVGGPAGESQLGKGAFQKMDVICWGFCSITKGNSK